MRNPTKDKNPGQVTSAQSPALRADAALPASPGLCSLWPELSSVRLSRGPGRGGVAGTDPSGPRLAFDATVVLLSFVLMTGGFRAAVTFLFCFCSQSLSSRVTCTALITRKMPRKSRPPSRCSRRLPQAASRASSLITTTPPWSPGIALKSYSGGHRLRPAPSTR